MWGTRMWAQVSGRDTWSARKKSRCTVAIAYKYALHCTKYTSKCICWATGRGLSTFCFLFTWIFFRTNEKEDVRNTETSNLVGFERIDPPTRNHHHPFFDGYCSTVQDLLDWFEVYLGFTELPFIQIDLCVLCVFVLYSRVSLSSCPFWTFCTASPARWECL